MNEIILKGIPAAPGITIGAAYILDKQEIIVSARDIMEQEIPIEIARFDEALMKTRECVIAVPTVDLSRKVVGIGACSGRDTDKFKAAKLTLGPASKIHTPIIMECPINIECVVRRVLDLGVHTMFVAEIKAVQATETLLTKSGRFAIEQAGLAAFAHGSYFALGQKLGFFGFSVQKRKKKRSR